MSGYLFILPNFLGFFLFAAGPIIASFLIAFTNWDLIHPPQLVGLKNFLTVFHARESLISMRQTFLFTAVNVPVQTAVALLVAQFLNRKIRGINILRTLFLLPWVTMPIAHALTFQWIYNRDFGVLNHFLGFFGVPKIDWLGRPDPAFIGILILNVWIYTGFHTIVLLSALQNVSTSLLEAASIDGAGKLRTFFSITLPVISPMVFYDMLVNSIGTLQVFDIAFALTGGGPGHTTFFYNLLLYRTGFTYWQFSLASAMGFVQFVVIALFAVCAFRIARRLVTYEQA